MPATHTGKESRRAPPASAWRMAIGLGALLLVAAAGSQPTNAFELFGIRFFGSDEEDTNTVVPDALPYRPTLTVAGDDQDLKDALTETSQLMSDVDSPPSGEAGLIARAVSDFERLVGRLFIDGRYGGTVDITLAGVPLQQALTVGNLPDQRPMPVAIHVDPGPLFHFDQIEIDLGVPTGDETALSNDPAGFGLSRGAVASSRRIIAAEQQIVAALHARGYPLARIASREIVADHATNTLDVTLVADPGGRATFGRVTVSGTERTDPAFVERQAMIPEGDQYDPKAIERAEKRLNDLGIFSSVRLVRAETLQPDGSLPITIEVSERKRNVIGLGANWSSTEGFGVEGYWRRRNLFGRGELLSIEGSVGRIGTEALDRMDYSARIAFEKPGVFGPLTSFTTSLGAKQESPDAYLSRNVTADAYLVREFDETLTGRAGVELYYADEEDVFGEETYFLAGIPADLVFDNRDDPLNPTKGIRASLFAEPAYDMLGENAMLFTKAEFSTYAALDDARRFVLAGRVAVGSIVGPSIPEIPAARRFFAGGGGSIRGYAYRNVGPRLNGEVTGGRSLFEASAEMRVKITDTIGVVGFVDAGNAFAAMYPDFSESLKIGVGAGVRYYTPVGPLRLDVAVPLDPERDDPDFAVYVGLSQAF